MESILIDYKCYKIVLGGENWELYVQNYTWTLQNRGKNVFPAHPASPSTIDHYLQTEIFSGEMSPAFRIQSLPWLCSAFTGIHTPQQFRGSHHLPSPDSDTSEPLPHISFLCDSEAGEAQGDQ